MTVLAEPKTALTLTGNRNQCTGCNEYFNHDYGFDRHRVGKHTGNQRGCLSVAEMVKKGFSKNAKGFWITEQQNRGESGVCKARPFAYKAREGLRGCLSNPLEISGKDFRCPIKQRARY